jgi:hypothetical protein
LKIPHTSLCVKKKVAKNLIYNKIYRISSDTEYLINLNKNYKGKYINFFFIFMEHGGLSTSIKHLFIKITEDLSILKKEFSYLFFVVWIYKILLKISGFMKNKNYLTLELIKQQKAINNLLL